MAYSFRSIILLHSSCRDVGGRPHVLIRTDDIEFLRGLNFTWNKIADILPVSHSTIYRCLIEEVISEECHCRWTAGFYHFTCYPNLHRQGIRIQRWRMRHRVDHSNTALRKSRTVQRSMLLVPMQYGRKHKLIHWRFVIHGAIDGYSRMITFLNCSTNNNAATVLTYFENAVAVHGLPSRIRADLGRDNVSAWHYMVQQHGTRECVLVGSSVHNERIERLWRDVFKSALSLFYEKFT